MMHWFQYSKEAVDNIILSLSELKSQETSDVFVLMTEYTVHVRNMLSPKNPFTFLGQCYLLKGTSGKIFYK